MFKTEKKNAVLVLTIKEKSELTMPTTERFIELIKACGISVKVDENTPDVSEARMYDCIFIDLSQCSLKGEITQKMQTLIGCSDVVFFNASETLTCESSALLAGVKGIFYKEDRPDIILKGLETIAEGDPWFKRSTMNKAVVDLLKLKQKSHTPADVTNSEVELPQLTKREQTIVHLVSSGAQNKEIAELLHISPNTVKTHIYSLFRKTSSRNRIELLTWSQQFNSASVLYSKY